jgi:hypothetical protein
MTVGGCTGSLTSLNGNYVSDSYVNGRRLYRLLDSPVFILFDPKNGFVFKNTEGTIIVRSNPVTLTADTPASAQFTYTSGCAVAAAAPTTILAGTVTRQAVTQSTTQPSLTNIYSSQFVSAKVAEVQSIALTTVDGLIFGGFKIDFNTSGSPVYIRGIIRLDITYICRVFYL